MTLPLGASQVYNLQLAHDHIVRVVNLNLFESNAEDSVASAWSEIHFVAANCLILYTVMVEVHDVVEGGNLNICQIVDCEYIMGIPF